MNYWTWLSRPFRRAVFSWGWRKPPMPPQTVPPQRILVLGIYLTDYKNQAERLVRDLSSSRCHRVEQKWIALGQTSPDESLRSVTVMHVTQKTPKFQLLNQLLASEVGQDFDWVLFVDDDVVLCRDFIDSYIAWVSNLNFSISQPARTRFSYRDHKFCLQKRHVRARETRFVEIGPIVCFDREAMHNILPFDERSPMGWGYDFAWPAQAEKLGLKMGIVDAVPVDHSYRAQSRTYSSMATRLVMEDFLGKTENFKPEQAMVNLKIY